jgi:hypothetical protein
MMKVQWTLILTVLLSMAGSLVGTQPQGPPQTPEQREWSRRYGQYADVLMKGDYKAFRQMVAPDAAWRLTGDQKRNVAQMQTEFARKLNTVKPNAQFTMNVTKLTVNGKEATVERTQVIAGFFNDTQGKRHRAFDGSGWEDRWVKTAQGWKLKHAKQFNETLTIDGRPGNPYARK